MSQGFGTVKINLGGFLVHTKGDVEINYDYKGRVDSVNGSARVEYDHLGRITSVECSDDAEIVVVNA
ncbi:MAG: hypothetical protein HY435_01600 [Candidatus Liptonbacteria bacterium]|nr:hypothetical protein [Candidatus Liptonbacteria bacterium]